MHEGWFNQERLHKRKKQTNKKKHLKPAFEKGVRCGQAMEKNEDITAPW